MSLTQTFDDSEHTSSGTTFETDVHGKVPYAISIDEAKAEVEIKEVLCLGSAYPVAWGEADGAGKLPKLTLKIRSSSLKIWEDTLRGYFDIDGTDRLEVASLSMTCSIISAPLDENNAELPTRVTKFKARYLGYGRAVDRGSADPIQIPIYLQQTTPATET